MTVSPQPTGREALVNKKFYLVDGHSQIMRAYWARMPDLITRSGEPTKATFLFMQLVLQHVDADDPVYFAVAMDTKEGATRRIALDPDYKAGRERMPEDLVPQINRIKSILDTARIPVLICPGEEADDVIATVVEKTKSLDLELFILSSDKDLYQLLSQRVKLYDPRTGAAIGPEELKEKNNVTPGQMVEIQTLAGDKVDNIPGIPGVGLKKAAVLVNKYGSAQNVLDHAEELSPKLSEKVKAFAEQLPVTRQLVTLRNDCPVDFDLEACWSERFALRDLGPVFKELQFTRLLPRIIPEAQDLSAAFSAETAEKQNAAAFRFETIATEEELRSLAGELRSAGVFALDTEASSLQPRSAALAGISFCWHEEGAVYIPVRSNKGETLPLSLVQEVLGGILADPSVEKVGQNLKYDLQVLRGNGFTLDGIRFDTMIASSLLQPRRQSHGLDALARELLHYTPIPITDLIGKGAKQISVLDADLERLSIYAAEDAHMTWRIWRIFKEQLAEENLEHLFYTIEIPLLSVLAEMEWSGIAVDIPFMKQLSSEFQEKLETLEARIHKEAGRSFNVNSPKQLAEILFDEQGLPVVRKTKTSRSTDAEVLKTLSVSQDNPLPSLMLSYRELSKLKNTYVDVLPDMVDRETGRLHPSYHQVVTATGRLSSSDPNIQNIPVRTEDGRRIRQAFIAGRPDAELLLGADYSQIELRMLAHLSGDAGLTQAFNEDRDIHSQVAAEIWGFPPTEVPREMRTRAKAVNFGIIYGQTAFGLSRTLGIPRGEAQDFIRRYNEKFPAIEEFVRRIIAEAENNGYAQTLSGRKRPIPEITSRNRTRKQQAERLAVNTTIQGSAADLIKLAMLSLHARIEKGELPARMLVQVHDELIFEIPKAEKEHCTEVISKEMEEAYPLSVPLKVDVACGTSWPK